MIYVVSNLVMNGGSTFLLRLARRMAHDGAAMRVLVLRDSCDPALRSALEDVAEIFDLGSFQRDRATTFRGHLSLFAPLDWESLLLRLRPSEGETLHAMGIMGLIFARRLLHHRPDLRPTVGIYHQNEFAFTDLPGHFIREIRADFDALAEQNIVFFNTSSRANYRDHFNRAFDRSPVLPIGVETGTGEARPAAPPPRVVSVGNLVGFKTYNRHMIDTLARTATRWPDLRYDIYGDGPERQALEQQIRAEGLSDRVRLMGPIPYAEMRETIADALLFIGSGTALIEAADMGLPAMTGIESVKTPVSYGWLSDVPGLDYNEDGLDLQRRGYEEMLSDVLRPGHRDRIGGACRTKAKEFSVDRTVEGFKRLEESALPYGRPLSPIRTARLAASFLRLGAAERLTGRRAFSKRRDLGLPRDRKA